MVLAVVGKNAKMAGFAGEEVFSKGVEKNSARSLSAKSWGSFEKLGVFLPMKNSGLLVKNVM